MCNCTSENLEIPGSSLPRRPGMTMILTRHPRPRPLRVSQAFERLGHAEHADVVEAAPDDLYADRKALRVITPVDRDGRVFGHVPRHGVADVFERSAGIVT